MAAITVEDLKKLDEAEIEKQISEKTAAYQELISKAKAEIGGLRQLLKVVRGLNGKETRKSPGPRKKKAEFETTDGATTSEQKSAGRPSNADKIENLLKLRGAMDVFGISRSLAMTDEATAKALKDNPKRFYKSGGMWHLH